MMGYFWFQNSRFTPNKHFLRKVINIIFIYLLTRFVVPNFKKPLQYTQDYEDATQNGLSFSKENFSENLLINLVSIIHLYLHFKNQSQISMNEI